MDYTIEISCPECDNVIEECDIEIDDYDEIYENHFDLKCNKCLTTFKIKTRVEASVDFDIEILEETPSIFFRNKDKMDKMHYCELEERGIKRLDVPVFKSRFVEICEINKEMDFESAFKICHDFLYKTSTNVLEFVH